MKEGETEGEEGDLTLNLANSIARELVGTSQLPSIIILSANRYILGGCCAAEENSHGLSTLLHFLKTASD